MSRPGAMGSPRRGWVRGLGWVVTGVVARATHPASNSPRLSRGGTDREFSSEGSRTGLPAVWKRRGFQRQGRRNEYTKPHPIRPLFRNPYGSKGIRAASPRDGVFRFQSVGDSRGAFHPARHLLESRKLFRKNSRISSSPCSCDTKRPVSEETPAFLEWRRTAPPGSPQAEGRGLRSGSRNLIAS